MIAVEDREDDPSGRHRHRSAAEAMLPVSAVAQGLRQFDIHLDGIDIVSVKVRRGGNAAELSTLEDWGPEEWDVVSDQPASYQRRTWLVLRMNPQRNVAAVAARDSLASTLVAATERLAQDLDGPTCVARPLTADELAEVDSAVLSDLEPTWSRPGWRHLKHFNGFVTSFWLSPSDIDSETLDRLWSTEGPDIGSTVVTLRLVSHGGRPHSLGLGALPQRQPAAQGCLGRTQPAHRAPVGRGAGQHACPDDSPLADRAQPGVAQRRGLGAVG